MSMPEKDIICVDVELKAVNSETIRYISELCDAISEYNQALERIQTHGIVDEKIRGKLAELADNLSSYQNTLNEIGNSLETDTRDFLSAINENDTFSFPV